MRIILFIISAIFSFVFYVFYCLFSSGKSVFGNEIPFVGETSSLTNNLIIETVIFFLLGVFFVVYFSSTNQEKKDVDKEVLFRFVFYIIIVIPLYFGLCYSNEIIIIFIILAILGDFVFSFLSNIKIFKKEKIKLRYFGLVLNYLTTLSSLFYLFLEFSYYLSIICVFSAVFNYQIHRKYKNYVSLFLSIITLISLFLIFFLKLREIYISFF